MDVLPRKRPRSEIDSPEDCVDAAHVRDGPVTRDETYYLTDGDCVIRVGDILFKVHRFLLVRDSSAFADMFSMPQGNGAANQLVTDENPIRLYDELEQFRALCWIIYALPMVYMDQTDRSKVDISKIISLYLIAHKYHFESHENFARKILQTHCAIMDEPPPHIEEYFTKCPESCFESLLRIACLTEAANSDNPSLPSVIQGLWMFRLEHPDVHNDSASYALRIAEELGLRTFMGKLYYFEFRATIDPHRIVGSTAFAHPPDNLTSRQRLAMYEGSWSLQHYWSQFMNAPLKQFNCPIVQPRHGCNRVWKMFLSIHKKELAVEPVSPLENLKEIESKVASMNKEVFKEVDISCIEPYINNIIKELEDSLADHFLQPVPGAPPTV